MRMIEGEGFSYDDVLLVPQYTKIASRYSNEITLETRLTKNLKIIGPIISSNMDTVTESKMAIAMAKSGAGAGVLHRFMSLERIMNNVRDIHYDQVFPVCISIGVGPEWGEYLTHMKTYKSLIDIVCIDVAHGHHQRVIDMIHLVKDINSGWEVIAGNVCTSEGVADLILAGADAIKVGVGPGSLCTTRLQTGCGQPQLSAIIECSKEAKKHNIPIIADGGIKHIGDIAKALAAGASTVMLGSMLAGHEECPGEIVEQEGQKFKRYRGMASRSAMNDWKKSAWKHITPEGEDMLVPLKGSVYETVADILGGLRSSMTYNNAATIEELQKNAFFRRVSSHTIMENKPHKKY